MLSEEELTSLLLDLESDRVERKERWAGDAPSKIREAICAFANDLPNNGLPGVVFVGVKDNGAFANISVDDKLLLTLSHMRSDGNILPFPVMTVQKHTLNGCELAVIQVEPAYNPPVRYDGRVWVRVGPRRATATIDDERLLTERSRANNLPFDRQEVRGATLEDLDLDFFKNNYLPSAIAPEILLENHRLVEQQLASLRFLTKKGYPTNAAILILDKDPRNWLPGAYIQFVRFAGDSLTDPIQSDYLISGPLSDLLRQLNEILVANISVSVDITSGPVEIKRPDYPIAALRQLVYNAVLHRNYESTNAPIHLYWFNDRIEINSPGGPYGRVNEANFGQPDMVDYRNPSLAEAMKVLGFVQTFGIGIATARRELEKNGNPTLEFQVERNRVVAIARKLA